MNNIDADQLLQEIINKAESEPSEFRFITSWADFVYCHRHYKATKIIIKVLKTASKSLFKEYCKSVTSRISDVTQLIAFTQLGDIIAYYEAELKTLDEMLDEYEEYLWSGNFFYSFLGGER